jgi:hypothetical protein
MMSQDKEATDYHEGAFRLGVEAHHAYQHRVSKREEERERRFIRDMLRKAEKGKK